MSEIYTRVFFLDKKLYAEGAPVIISAGALLVDNQSNDILAQLKFQNITDNIIKAISVQIVQLDVLGNKLGDTVPYQYLDLHLSRDEEEGQKVPVYLPDRTTRSFRVSIEKVIFDDNKIWECKEDRWLPLTPQVTLEQYLGSHELVKQYCIKYGNNCKYKPYMQYDLWQCSCGVYNHNSENVCHKCGNKIAELASINLDQLKEECGARIKIEKKRRNQKNAAEAKRRKKIAISISGIIVAILIISIGTKSALDYVDSNNSYNSAVTLMESGNYEEANEIFESLGGFKDSQELSKESVYRMASELIEDDRAEEAISVLSSIPDYKDSENLITNLQTEINMDTYNLALSNLQAHNYMVAIELFSSLGNFEDSAEQLKFAQNENRVIKELYNSVLSAYELMTTLDVTGKFENSLTSLYLYCGQFNCTTSSTPSQLFSDFYLETDFDFTSDYLYVLNMDNYCWDVAIPANESSVFDGDDEGIYNFMDSKGKHQNSNVSLNRSEIEFTDHVFGEAEFVNGNISLSINTRTRRHGPTDSHIADLTYVKAE